jgi:hypothetical protein
VAKIDRFSNFFFGCFSGLETVLKPNTFANFEVPAKIAYRNFFFAISGAVNQFFLTISCLVIIQYQKMAEKIQINLSNDQKKSSDEQFLQVPRNWQKCSASDIF